MQLARVLLFAAAICSSRDVLADTRSARLTPAPGQQPQESQTFDPEQSAALFVGVSRFPYDSTLAEVHYAVDDAVDLAVVLALDERVRLVPPSRVILALSGEPQKPESRKNLERL